MLPNHRNCPAIVAYRDKLKANLYPDGFPPGRPSEYDLAGYAAGKVTETALEKAGKNLSREAFIDALEGLKGFDTGVAFPITLQQGQSRGEQSKWTSSGSTPDLKWESVGKIGAP